MGHPPYSLLGLSPTTFLSFITGWAAPRVNTWLGQPLITVGPYAWVGHPNTWLGHPYTWLGQVISGGQQEEEPGEVHYVCVEHYQKHF